VYHSKKFSQICSPTLQLGPVVFHQTNLPTGRRSRAVETTWTSETEVRTGRELGAINRLTVSGRLSTATAWDSSWTSLSLRNWTSRSPRSVIENKGSSKGSSIYLIIIIVFNNTILVKIQQISSRRLRSIIGILTNYRQLDHHNSFESGGLVRRVQSN